MRVLVQRVRRARVTVGEELVGAIGPGLVLLVGFHGEDDERAVEFCADKCAHLRIFPDAAGKMNLSLLDAGGEALIISQFTLYGDCRRGRRPSFNQAAPPGRAELLYARFLARCQALGMRVARGRFGAHMLLDLTNDGPVTIMIESPGTESSPHA